MAKTKVASRKQLGGKAAVDSAITISRRLSWRKISGATGLSTKPTILTMLAEAVCKLEGFIYAPSDSVYWQQGHSTERDFIYVTTQNLSHDQLQGLSDEVGDERSLLVLCSLFEANPTNIPISRSRRFPRAFLPAASGAMMITA